MHNKMRWLVRCDCGNESVTFEFKLKGGAVKSCGCGYATLMKNYRRQSHGMSGSVEYRILRGIKQRCLNPNDPRYPRYGGRGIKVCDRWLESFSNFYADMGSRPSPVHSIDRIDNDGHYSPENCRWATPDEQYANQPPPPNSTYLELDGVRATLSHWCAVTGIKRTTIEHRLNKGWDVKRALTTPIRHY